MLIKVLGSAAGGGFPQWNCNAETSRRAWAGDPRARARTQSSLAVSCDGEAWLLLNASPDIRQQIAANKQLQPRVDGPRRQSPIRAIILTNADVDHVAGLLSLRERQPLTIYASDRVLRAISANSIFDVLSPDHVARLPLTMECPTPVRHRNDDLGLTVEPFAVPGKIALYLEDPSAGAALGTRDGDTVGLKITEAASGRSFYYLPACAAVDTPLRHRLRGSALVFFDGTLYSDDELIRQGLSDKTGQRMGHMSMSGINGSMASLADLDIGRRIYVHINTSNPALIEGSVERAAVERAGWEIAYDGMEVRL